MHPNPNKKPKPAPFTTAQLALKRWYRKLTSSKSYRPSIRNQISRANSHGDIESLLLNTGASQGTKRKWEKAAQARRRALDGA